MIAALYVARSSEKTRFECYTCCRSGYRCCFDPKIRFLPPDHGNVRWSIDRRRPGSIGVGAFRFCCFDTTQHGDRVRRSGVEGEGRTQCRQRTEGQRDGGRREKELRPRTSYRHQTSHFDVDRTASGVQLKFFVGCHSDYGTGEQTARRPNASHKTSLTDCGLERNGRGATYGDLRVCRSERVLQRNRRRFAFVQFGVAVGGELDSSGREALCPTAATHNCRQHERNSRRSGVATERNLPRTAGR